uniref:Uncharacterized protein n=1 Tax=Heterorhabditis bacteriophora TaxID=37862 RepID=A0A1I7XJM8_HETBA
MFFYSPVAASKTTSKLPVLSKPTKELAGETMERKPRVVLREKKRGSAARLAMKEQWRSSSNLLDSIYHDISKTIPTVEAMSTLDLRRSAAPSISPSHRPIGRRSASLAHLTATPSDSPESIRAFNKRFGSSTPSETSSNKSGVVTEMIEAIDELMPMADRLAMEQYPELHALVEYLKQWQSLFKRPRTRSGTSPSIHRSSVFLTPSTASDELDDNVLVSGDMHSENDSGIDSLRQHYSPYVSDGIRKRYGESGGKKKGDGLGSSKNGGSLWEQY